MLQDVWHCCYPLYHSLPTSKGDRTFKENCEDENTTKAKEDRMQQRNDKMKLDEADARMARSKREGTYRRGMNMDEFGANGYTEEELRTMANQCPAKKSRSSAQQMDITCKHCGLQGHSTTRSKQCLKYKQPTVVVEQHPIALPGEDLELLGIDAVADVLAMDMLALRPEDDNEEEEDVNATAPI
jgi:hypothetical protein